MFVLTDEGLLHRKRRIGEGVLAYTRFLDSLPSDVRRASGSRCGLHGLGGQVSSILIQPSLTLPAQ